MSETSIKTSSKISSKKHNVLPYLNLPALTHGSVYVQGNTYRFKASKTVM